jgi:hypothetical protein
MKKMVINSTDESPAFATEAEEQAWWDSHEMAEHLWGAPVHPAIAAVLRGARLERNSGAVSGKQQAE